MSNFSSIIFSTFLISLLALNFLAFQFILNDNPQSSPFLYRISRKDFIGTLTSWISAMCYLGSRVPQIYSNIKKRCVKVKIELILGGEYLYVFTSIGC